MATKKKDYERVYLLETRLKDSINKDSIAFLEKAATEKIIKYSVSAFINKYSTFLSFSGIQFDDLMSVARSLTLVFFSKYSAKFESEKDVYFVLCRFLGQKLFNYLKISQKRYPYTIDETLSKRGSRYSISRMALDTESFDDAVANDYLVNDLLHNNMKKITDKQARKLIRVARKKVRDEFSFIAMTLCYEYKLIEESEIEAAYPEIIKYKSIRV